MHLTHDKRRSWPCPECGEACSLYDHQPERRWRHLDICQFKTILHAEPPRSNCIAHGPRAVRLPWAEPNSRCTALFEAIAIEWLKVASQQAVAGQMGLSWDEVHAIQERAVARGRARCQREVVEHLGVDEKSFTRGHRYFTLVNDLDRGRVLFVSEGRSEESMDSFWATLTQDQEEGVEAAAMDMWDPYIHSTRRHSPAADGKIVFDKFHIAKHLSEAVDRVRHQENKQLRAAGDDRLTGTRYDWLRHPARMEAQDRKEFAALRDSNLKAARAWALKEVMMAFFCYVYERPARKHFRWWHNWAVCSRLTTMLEKARISKRRFENIVTYLKHRITNAATESLNSKIQWVKYTARGLRSKRPTSSPRSTSTAEGSISRHPRARPTKIPECPQKEGMNPDSDFSS